MLSVMKTTSLELFFLDHCEGVHQNLLQRLKPRCLFEIELRPSWGQRSTTLIDPMGPGEVNAEQLVPGKAHCQQEHDSSPSIVVPRSQRIGDPAGESSQARRTHLLKASVDKNHTCAATQPSQRIKARSRRRILEGQESWTAGDGLFRRFPVMVTVTGMDSMGDYTVAIWATIGLVVVFTVPVVWQFMQPNDDDFGDLTKRRK